MEYFSEPFHISLLKNHILKDPINDWFNIQELMENNKYKRDSNSYYKKFILKESNEYKKNILNKIREKSGLKIPIKTSLEDTIRLINNRSPIILSGNLQYESMNVYCDVIITLEYFNLIFPHINNIPFHLLCGPSDYILINISYSSIHFKMDLKESLNEGILLYKKCCNYAFQLALQEIVNYESPCLILGKDYYYKKTRLPREEFISIITFNDKIKEKFKNAYQWILKLRKLYTTMNIDPYPSHNELYPNMNYTESDWENEKYKLANRIKEITLVWNISYEDRCTFLKKNIKCWDDPKLLSFLKESKKKDIQERMIHMNQQKDVLIYPRKNISHNFLESLKETNYDIYFDIESFLSIDEKSNAFKNKINKDPILAIIGFIHNNRFKEFIISNYSKKDEETLVKNLANYLFKLSNNKSIINIYHWGQAEYNYFQYIHKNYPNIQFPNYKLIDILDYFRMEPIIVQGVFKFGLKSIGKALYKNGLINTTWDNNNDNGLDAMIRFKEICKSHTKKIPIKRYLEVADIIHYNHIDCKVLHEIVNLLRKNYN